MNSFSKSICQKLFESGNALIMSLYLLKEIRHTIGRIQRARRAFLKNNLLVRAVIYLRENIVFIF